MRQNNELPDVRLKDLHRMSMAHEKDRALVGEQQSITNATIIPSEPLLALPSAEESSNDRGKYTEETQTFRHSLISNILFFLGSLFYLMVDLIDLHQFKKKQHTENSNDDDYSNQVKDDGDSFPSIPIYGLNYNMSMSTLLYILATLSYLLNACYDYKWATHEDEKEDGGEEYHVITQEQEPCITSGAKPEHQDTELDFVGTSRSFEDNVTPIAGSKASGFWSRVHIETTDFPYTSCFISKARDEAKTEKLVAIIFGLSAMIDFLGAILNDLNPLLSRHFYILACHGYAIEAVVAIVEKHGLQCPAQSRSAEVGTIDSAGTISLDDGQSCLNENVDSGSTVRLLQRMMLIGDALFLIGSMIDVVLSYFLDVHKVADTLIFEELMCLSSILWLIDSVIYLMAGILIKEEESHSLDSMD